MMMMATDGRRRVDGTLDVQSLCVQFSYVHAIINLAIRYFDFDLCIASPNTKETKILISRIKKPKSRRYCEHINAADWDV